MTSAPGWPAFPRCSTTSSGCSTTIGSSASAPSTSAWSAPTRRSISASPAPCCARRACRGICARVSPTRSTTSWTSTCRSGVTATASIVIWCAWRRCVSRCDHGAVPRPDAARAGQDSGLQDRAAAAFELKRLDGGAHPSLQVVHGRISCACRRDLRRGRGAQGRIRGLSGRRRHQPALSLPGPRVQLPHLAALEFMARGMLPDIPAIIGAMDIVFGEIDR